MMWAGALHAFISSLSCLLNSISYIPCIYVHPKGPCAGLHLHLVGEFCTLSNIILGEDHTHDELQKTFPICFSQVSAQHLQEVSPFVPTPYKTCGYI